MNQQLLDVRPFRLTPEGACDSVHEVRLAFDHKGTRSMVLPATARGFNFYSAFHAYLSRQRDDTAAIEVLAAWGGLPPAAARLIVGAVLVGSTRREAPFNEVLDEPVLVALDRLRSEEYADAACLRVALLGGDQNTKPWLSNRTHTLLLSEEINARAAAYLLTRLAAYSVLDWSRWDRVMGPAAQDASGA